MRSLRVLSIFMCVLALASFALAGERSMGVREVSSVTFVASMRVGSVVLPAGDYVIRHTMDGQEQTISAPTSILFRRQDGDWKVELIHTVPIPEQG